MLNSIIDNVLNRHLESILNMSPKASKSRGLWRTRDFSRSLMQDANYRTVDFKAILGEVFQQTERHLTAPFSPNSRKRGLRRGFVPLGKKAIEEAIRGRKLEVPLERALALKNGWYCQFAALSGFRNKPTAYKRKSIDLLVECSDQEAFLIELKQWRAEDTILFATLEIILNWFCFIIVRQMDMMSGNLPANRWPTYGRFNLRVMGPENYFKRQPGGSLDLVDWLNNTLGKFARHLDKKYRVTSCDISATQLSISEEEFTGFVAQNSKTLTRSESKPADLVGGKFLCIKP